MLNLILISLFLNGLVFTSSNTVDTTSALSTTIELAAKNQGKISSDRKYSLNKLVDAIKKQRKVLDSTNIVFICTHNSRRSQMAELLSTAIAHHLKVDNFKAFSGGTEEAAFNDRAVSALSRAGFVLSLESDSEKENPTYTVKIDPNSPAKKLFSKHYEDPFNPQENFIAAMVCSSADKSCPVVQGADYRVSIPYLDPKDYDGTDIEAEKYDERVRQIAAEMYYVLSRID